MFQYHNFQSLNPNLITNTECIFLYSTKLKIETVETKLGTEYELLAGQLLARVITKLRRVNTQSKFSQ